MSRCRRPACSCGRTRLLALPPGSGSAPRVPSRWLLETHEFIQLVAGSMTVTVDGGEPVKVNTGDSAFFPKGWSGTWDIHETLRKVYTIF